MSTTPSTQADTTHRFSEARDFGQGEHRYCLHCGAREGTAQAEQPCAPAVVARAVRSYYDPFG